MSAAKVAPATSVGKCMSRRVVTVSPDRDLAGAAKLMRARKIRHLPVVDARGRLVGIVTARDLRQALFAPAVQDSPDEVLRLLNELVVRDVMTRGALGDGGPPRTREAARLMHERKLGALPVVERDRLVGILTET